VSSSAPLGAELGAEQERELGGCTERHLGRSSAELGSWRHLGSRLGRGSWVRLGDALGSVLGEARCRAQEHRQGQSRTRGAEAAERLSQKLGRRARGCTSDTSVQLGESWVRH
jgi:hypothetical protein